jgi:hypothetical protein
MVFIALYLLYCLTILFLAGLVLQRLLVRLRLWSDATAQAAIHSILVLGLIGLTTFVSLLSCIIPIDATVHGGILFILVLAAVVERTYIPQAVRQLYLQLKANVFFVALAFLCIVIALFHAAGPVTLFDTGLYHAQAVKWIQEYGAVPGLGNLHHRLAFNSSWFCFSAFLDLGPFTGKSAHVVNLIVIVLALCMCFSGFCGLYNGNYSMQNCILCLLSLPLCLDTELILEFLTSLSPDLCIVILLIYQVYLVVTCLEHETPETHPGQGQGLFTLSVFMAFFLPTVKLSALVVLVFPLLLFFRPNYRSRKPLLLTGLLGIVIILPFLVRNVILSGYLIFPFPEVDLFSFDWKIPAVDVVNIRQGIRYFAINPQPGAGPCSVAAMGTREWITFWVGRHAGNPLLHWVLGSGVAALIFLAICVRRRLNVCLPMVAVYGVVVAGMVYWFCSAPLLRFGKGWLWAFIILSCAGILYVVLGALRPPFVKVLSSAAGVVVSFGLLSTAAIDSKWDGCPPASLGTRLWKTCPLPRESMKVIEIHPGLSVYVPRREKAWDAALPSAPAVDLRLRMRGVTLKEGFRVTQESG